MRNSDSVPLVNEEARIMIHMCLELKSILLTVFLLSKYINEQKKKPLLSSYSTMWFLIILPTFDTVIYHSISMSVYMSDQGKITHILKCQRL